MIAVNLQFKSLHHIDIYSPDIRSVDIDIDVSDIDEYIDELLDKVTNNNNRRLFEFQSETCEIKNALNKMITQRKFTEVSEIIARRLHRKEIEAQEKYGHLTNIHKGSILQFYIIDGESYTYIITKVDHNTFIDENDLLKHFGLPFEKRVLKAAIIKLNENCEVKNIDIYDTNTTISNYWWSSFLELNEINSNEHNTKTSFNLFDSILRKKLKKQYPSDYTYIRNSMISYYRTQESFVLDNFMDYILSDYQPVDKELDINELKQKFYQAPSNKNVDTQFTIEKEVITAKFKRIIQLHEKIDLNLKEDISNIENIINSYQNPAGEKFIQIKTDSGYEYFKRNINNTNE